VEVLVIGVRSTEVDVWIQTSVLGDGQEVLPLNIHLSTTDSHLLHEVGRNGIGELDIAQTEIGSILNEVGGYLLTGCIRRIQPREQVFAAFTVRVIQHPLGAVTLEHVEVCPVTNIVKDVSALLSFCKHSKIPVFIPCREIDTVDEIRVWVTKEITICCCDHTILVHIPEVEHTFTGIGTKFGCSCCLLGIEETTTSANVGFDANLLRNRLEVVFDWYTRTTSDMLAQIAVARAQGQGTLPFTNIGTMRNRGIDLNLNWSDKAFNGQIRYSIGVNIVQFDHFILVLGNVYTN